MSEQENGFRLDLEGNCGADILSYICRGGEQTPPGPERLASNE